MTFIPAMLSAGADAWASLALSAGRTKGAERGVDDPGAEERGDLPHVVLRRDLDHLHADQSLAGDDAQHAEDLARRKPTWLGGTGAGSVARIEAVDVEGEKDG